VTEDWQDVLIAMLETGVRLLVVGAHASPCMAFRGFVRPETVVQLGLPPNRIDILTGITGVEDFGQAWAARTEREIGNYTIPFLGRETLIANKRAAGRLKDLWPTSKRSGRTSRSQSVHGVVGGTCSRS